METEERIKALEEQVKDLRTTVNNLVIINRGFTDCKVADEERNEVEYIKLRIERHAMSLVHQRMIERKYLEYAGELERIKDHMRIMEQDNLFLKAKYEN